MLDDKSWPLPFVFIRGVQWNAHVAVDGRCQITGRHGAFADRSSITFTGTNHLAMTIAAAGQAHRRVHTRGPARDPRQKGEFMATEIKMPQMGESSSSLDIPIPYAGELEDSSLPDPDSIAEQARALARY